MISVVAACSRNLVIGREGRLPWRIPADLRRFRDLTLGKAVVMGRKTFESLPEPHRPLSGRRNIVVTSNRRFREEGVESYDDLPMALAAAGDECFVIGGSDVFRQVLPLSDRVYLTHVDVECDGDARFPALDPGEWSCIEESEPLVDNGHRFMFRTYDRVR